MATTINMGLTKWPSGSDPFAHTALASDMDLVDAHDHTSGHGVQVPTAGLANLAVTTGKLADASATKVKLGADVDYESAFSVWKTLAFVSAVHTGATLFANGTLYYQFPWIFYHAPADVVAGARTTAYRLRFSVLGNGISSTITDLSASLREVVSVGGGASTLTPTLGGAITSSIASITPAINTRLQSASASFALSTASWYVPVILPNANQAATSVIQSNIALQYRQT